MKMILKDIRAKAQRRKEIQMSKAQPFFAPLRLCASICLLFFAVGARAETTNALSDAEIQGRNLARQLLELRPTENFTNSGVLQIRDGKGKRSEIPVDCWVIIVMGASWSSIYEAEATNQFVTLCDMHAVDKLNTYSYSTSYWTNSTKTGSYVWRWSLRRKTV